MSLLRFEKSFLDEDIDCGEFFIDTTSDTATDKDMDMNMDVRVITYITESSKKLHVERMCVSAGGSIHAWKVDDA